jgi:hypothetical protein
MCAPLRQSQRKMSLTGRQQATSAASGPLALRVKQQQMYVVVVAAAECGGSR